MRAVSAGRTGQGGHRTADQHVPVRRQRSRRHRRLPPRGTRFRRPGDDQRSRRADLAPAAESVRAAGKRLPGCQSARFRPDAAQARLRRLCQTAKPTTRSVRACGSSPSATGVQATCSCWSCRPTTNSTTTSWRSGARSSRWPREANIVSTTACTGATTTPGCRNWRWLTARASVRGPKGSRRLVIDVAGGKLKQLREGADVRAQVVAAKGRVDNIVAQRQPRHGRVAHRVRAAPGRRTQHRTARLAARRCRPVVGNLVVSVDACDRYYDRADARCPHRRLVPAIAAARRHWTCRCSRCARAA